MAPQGLLRLPAAKEGGGQGNSLTNQFYPMSADRALKKTEADHQGALVRAFQDDTILGGSVQELVGVDKASGARGTLDDHLSTKRHPDKGRAYSFSPEGRGLFPADMEQHHYTVQHADGSETKHFGMVIAGAAISLDPVY